ncbi:ChbG/HpnK family deacetylase [Algoriphagus halophytocola]|uniref:ChbG/HpnK family deacetylase n=1 Tax=Algoriphagus halophytocola TaxID=2991499 RepID=UPI0022DDA596|nr:ChbG/HpnK family deacetylase [Algoriphagus sp. TR-M9]WBL41206.1 ChbG/HpnK family deacetylase [Algoriphagus sp. TR-M9]
MNSKKLKVLRKNTEVVISHAVKGERYMDSDIWYVLENNCFVWSGAISTSRDIPLIEKSIIVTADDIGVVEEIDIGAKLALYHGYINSLAVFVNRPNDPEGEYLKGFADSLKKHKRRGSSISLYQSSHIGLHFTITSGKPVADVSEVRSLVDSDGFFRRFHKFNIDYEDSNLIEQIKIEFDAQYERFKRVFGREPDHLTSHHDVHTFNKPLFYYFHKWSLMRGIPIRTHKFLPSSKRFLYDLLAVSPLQLDLPSIDSMNVWENEIRKEGSGAPDHTFVGHYGPVPLFGILCYRWAVKRKHRRLRKWMKEFLTTKDSKGEILIHLMKSKYKDQRDFKRAYAYLEAEYPGVEIKYFDGRVAEYKSLEEYQPWDSLNSFNLAQVRVKLV